MARDGHLGDPKQEGRAQVVRRASIPREGGLAGGVSLIRVRRGSLEGWERHLACDSGG